MFKTLLLLSFLLVNTIGFSQVKFFAGLSASPNVAVGTFANQSSDTYSDKYGKYAQGFSIGGGINGGVYLGKRFFILTGLERMGRKYSYHETFSDAYGNLTTDKYTETDHSWEIPVLANVLLSGKESVVTAFLSAGFIGGKTTKVNGTGASIGGGTTSTFSGSGSQIFDPYFVDASFGVGAKIRLHERLSLLILPDIRYQISHPEYNTVYTATLRTMLFYNF